MCGVAIDGAEQKRDVVHVGWIAAEMKECDDYPFAEAGHGADELLQLFGRGVRTR